MRLSKSSLYQSFGNKEALLISCIDHYQTAFNQKLSELLKASTSGLGFIAQLLESVIREANGRERKGCLLVNTVNELGTNEPIITAAIDRGFNAVHVTINKALAQARHATSQHLGTPVTNIHSPTQRMGDALVAL
ncbi:MAG TPA: TetR/AcrR family transcriptional regulator, partial [Methylococcales bacterium]|nr:TetR/AcrR family transcriptional regulator [Methylococcales bacterium]